MSRDERGHFISLLFRCALMTAPDERLRCKSSRAAPGEWMWHRGCPEDIIEVHEMYREFIQ